MLGQEGRALALAFVAQWETLRQHPERDEVGNWVIGYGFPADPGAPRMSEVEAQARLAAKLGVVERAVVLATRPASLTQGQMIALVSFTHSQGLGTLLRSSLLKHLRAGSPLKAAQDFTNWIMVRGPDGFQRPSERLKQRREAEKALFLRPAPRSAQAPGLGQGRTLG